jgi:hypothetical protein
VRPLLQSSDDEGRLQKQAANAKLPAKSRYQSSLRHGADMFVILVGGIQELEEGGGEVRQE